MNNKTVASTFAKHYDIPVRAFGLSKSKIGSNEHIFRRLITNMIVGGTLEENAINATLVIFKEYKNCEGLATAKEPKVKGILTKNGVRFAGRKAEYIIQVAKNMMHHHKGQVPNNRKALEQYRGVGRHVASIVLALGYDQNHFAVDLHVKRIAKRLGLITKKDSERVIEETLTKGVAPENYAKYSRAFVDFGKEYCGANPNCSECFLKAKCGKVEEVPKTVTASMVKQADGVYEIVAGSSERAYNVTIKQGAASCNCKGFRFRRTCSHVKEIIA